MNDRFRALSESSLRDRLFPVLPLLRHSAGALFRPRHRLLRIAVRAYDASTEKNVIRRVGKPTLYERGLRSADVPASLEV
jgi:hypothetical protein